MGEQDQDVSKYLEFFFVFFLFFLVKYNLWSEKINKPKSFFNILDILRVSYVFSCQVQGVW